MVMVYRHGLVCSVSWLVCSVFLVGVLSFLVWYVKFSGLGGGQGHGYSHGYWFVVMVNGISYTVRLFLFVLWCIVRFSPMPFAYAHTPILRIAHDFVGASSPSRYTAVFQQKSSWKISAVYFSAEVQLENFSSSFFWEKSLWRIYATLPYQYSHSACVFAIGRSFTQ